MKSFVLAAAVGLCLPTQAIAEQCSPELLQEKTGAIFIYLQDHPEKASKMSIYKAEVEAEYEGKPSNNQLCEALDKIMARLEADK
ncbi:MAG: hypothetical protein ABJN40_04025 [Sneathiella sp.]